MYVRIRIYCTYSLYLRTYVLYVHIHCTYVPMYCTYIFTVLTYLCIVRTYSLYLRTYGTFRDNFNDVRSVVGRSFFGRSSVVSRSFLGRSKTAHVTFVPSWYNCIILTRCESFHRELRTEISEAVMVYSNYVKQRILHLRRTGKSYSQIADHLASEGHYVTKPLQVKIPNFILCDHEAFTYAFRSQTPSWKASY